MRPKTGDSRPTGRLLKKPVCFVAFNCLVKIALVSPGLCSNEYEQRKLRARASDFFMSSLQTELFRAMLR